MRITFSTVRLPRWLIITNSLSYLRIFYANKHFTQESPKASVSCKWKLSTHIDKRSIIWLANQTVPPSNTPDLCKIDTFLLMVA